MRIAIVGAGLAGLACAERLAAAGAVVSLFDKGRAAGGRMSTRRAPTSLGEASFDHGAQYMTARDPAFRAKLDQWRREGLVAPWPAAGEEAWVGLPAMNAPVRAMAARLAVRSNARIDALTRDAAGWHLAGPGTDEGGFAALVVAVPAEQAGPLVAPSCADFAAQASATVSDPCWTVMAAYPERLPVEADVMRGAGAVGWAARNSAKPGRTGPESWVVQADPAWSRRHLERPADEVANDLLAEFHAAAGLAAPPTLAVSAHRWRYARSGAAGAGALWSPGLGLGLCGDWLLGPRVECAWLSGHGLAGTIASHVEAPAA